MKRFLPGLLSRSSALAAASLALGVSLFSAPAAALTVTIGSNCPASGPYQYATITVAGSGDVTVQCPASGPVPGTFALSAPGSININTSGNTATTVTRSGGSSGAVTVNYSATGVCTTSASSVSFADSDAAAKTISLSTGAGTGNCTVSLTSASAGTVGSPNSVNIAVVNPTAPGTISLTAPATLVANFTTTTQIVVNRTGGSAGAQTVNYSAAGTCSSAASSVSFADGSSTAQPIVVTTGATTGACTVTLTSVTGTATLGSPTAASITVNAPPPGCPTEPDNLIVAGNFAGMGNALVPGGGPSFSPNTPGTVSGQIIAIPLPAISILSPRSSGVISIGETSTAASPNPVTLHVSISKCRGAISTDTTNQCNLVSGNGNYNAITWFGQPYSIVNGPAPANLRGWCWAPSSEGQWYINARWIHNGCAAGAPTCGFAFQFGFGPY